MNLTEEQKIKVAKWAEEGASVAEIQTKLTEEFNMHISFMDVRLLLVDINVAVKDKETPKPKVVEPEFSNDVDSELDDEKEPDNGGLLSDDDPGDGEKPVASNVKVELSKVARPGMAVNGDVTFSDGMTAQWGITQYGEISLAPAKDGYRPTHEDIAAFQAELRKLLQP